MVTTVWPPKHNSYNNLTDRRIDTNDPYKIDESASPVLINFGSAIKAAKEGRRVTRQGWNGKGMFVIYIPGTPDVTFIEDSPYEKALRDTAFADMTVPILPHFDMFTFNTEGRRAILPGWLASQSDMDAEDWMVV